MAISGNAIKEQISVAYVHAICASAGCSFDVLKCDEVSIDAIIKKKFLPSEIGEVRPPANLDVQLKSSSVLDETETHITFKLPVKNYNDLRVADESTAMLLIVLQLSATEDAWVSTQDDCLTARRSAYWFNLSGMPETTNTATVTLHIPKSHILTRDTLRDLMVAVAREETINNAEVDNE